LQLTDLIIGKAAYQQLRTNEQLGYIVHSYADQNSQIESFKFFVQSGTYSSAHVQERISLFLQNYWLELQAMPTNTYQLYVETLQTIKEQPLLALGDANELYWNEIRSQQYIFNRRQEHLRLIKKYFNQPSSFATFLLFFQHLFRINTTPPQSTTTSTPTIPLSLFRRVLNGRRTRGREVEGAESCWGGLLKVGIEPNKKQSTLSPSPPTNLVLDPKNICSFETTLEKDASNWIDLLTLCQYRDHSISFTLQSFPLNEQSPLQVQYVSFSDLKSLTDQLSLFPTHPLHSIPTCSRQSK